jgi:aminopeptidase N
MRRFATLALCLAALPLSAQRLPPEIRPSHYAIALDIDIDGRHFSGEESIDVTTKNETDTITLNALGLTIEHAAIDDRTATVTTNTTSEQITLSADRPLAPGAHRIALKWSAPLSDTKLQGLYISKSKRRAYVATQFEGTYARMMFPSFDEPAFKATFDLSVVIAKGDTAISNGAIARDEPAGEGRHRITFTTSPKMSTYLLALAIGDFACASATEAGVPIRVCSIPEKLEETRFPIEATQAALRFYQQYFSIKYPFGKLDLVAIPDYEWGGMENTACIFFRESSLLVGKNPSGSTKQGLSGLISHEIAHQWFGDIVTAAWWDDIWLNEGFATWIANKPLAQWHPEWPTTEAAARDTQGAIGVDSLGSTRAIHGVASTPGEIKEMFDGISYDKGAALLRMLESYIGATAFRNGVNAYLTEHAFANATSGDFAAALARASGKPVDAILRAFMMQPGVPLVTFARSCENGRGTITMTQERFSLRGSVPAQRWSIPVCVKLGNGETSETRCELLEAPSVAFDTATCAEWIFGNAGALGYYRSAYAPEEVVATARHARKALTAPERVAMIEDSWAGVRAGRTSIAPFLDIASALEGENVRAVISSLAGKLFFVRDRLVRGEDRAVFDKWLRDTFAPAAREIGWTPAAKDTDQRRELRASLLRVLGSAGDPGAVQAATRIVDDALKGKDAPDTALLDASFDVAARNGDAKLYERIAVRLPKAATTQEHYRLLYALAAFARAELGDRTLGLVKTGVVKINDYPVFFASMLDNPATRELAWTYLKEHWSDLGPKVVSFGGRGAIPALGAACNAPFRDDVRQFFATHPAPGAERALAQALEQIDACLTVRERNEVALHTWIAERRPNGR